MVLELTGRGYHLGIDPVILDLGVEVPELGSPALSSVENLVVRPFLHQDFGRLPGLQFMKIDHLEVLLDWFPLLEAAW